MPAITTLLLVLILPARGGVPADLRADDVSRQVHALGLISDGRRPLRPRDLPRVVELASSPEAEVRHASLAIVLAHEDEVIADSATCRPAIDAATAAWSDAELRPQIVDLALQQPCVDVEPWLWEAIGDKSTSRTERARLVDAALLRSPDLPHRSLLARQLVGGRLDTQSADDLVEALLGLPPPFDQETAGMIALAHDAPDPARVAAIAEADTGVAVRVVADGGNPTDLRERALAVVLAARVSLSALDGVAADPTAPDALRLGLLRANVEAGTSSAPSLLAAALDRPGALRSTAVSLSADHWSPDLAPVLVRICDESPGHADCALEALRAHGSAEVPRIEALRYADRLTHEDSMIAFLKIYDEVPPDVFARMPEDTRRYANCLGFLALADVSLINDVGAEDLGQFTAAMRQIGAALSAGISAFNSGYYGGMPDTSRASAVVDRLKPLILARLDLHQTQRNALLAKAAGAYLGIQDPALKARILDHFVKADQLPGAFFTGIWFRTLVEDT